MYTESVESIKMNLAVLCNAILPDPFFVSFDCHQKHRYFREETANKWRQRVKTVMAGVKLVLFIQTYEETQIMSNYGRHKSICFWLLNLCLIFTFSSGFLPPPPLVSSAPFGTLFLCTGNGTAWLILALPSWTDVTFCSGAWAMCWKSCLHFPETTCM